LRGLSLVALSRNSLYPDLVIGFDSVTIRVICRHRLLFGNTVRAMRALERCGAGLDATAAGLLKAAATPPINGGL